MSQKPRKLVLGSASSETWTRQEIFPTVQEERQDTGDQQIHGRNCRGKTVFTTKVEPEQRSGDKVRAHGVKVDVADGA